LHAHAAADPGGQPVEGDGLRAARGVPIATNDRGLVLAAQNRGIFA
jgi:hypothetical protein